MAFDTSSNRQAPRRSSPASLPEAPPPSSTTWSALRDDGIHWQGQVILVGAGVEIAAILVLTANRFVLISGGEIALEVPRAWLRPEPKLLAESDARISITPQGGASQRGETDQMTVRVREGRGAGARLVSAISGRLISAREDRAVRRSEPVPGWGASIRAATPMALPPLPDFDDDSELRRAARSWPPVEQHGVPASTPSASSRASRQHAASASISAWTAANLEDTPEPGEASGSWGKGQASPATHARTAASNNPSPVIEERHQFNRGLVWGLRTLILAILIGTGAYFGQDSLPANLNLTLPASIEQRFQRFGLLDEPDDRDLSQVPADDGDTGTGMNPETPEPTKPSSDGTSGPPNSDLIGTSSNDDEGVGGQDSEITPVDPGIGTYADPTVPPQADEPTAPSVEPTAPPVEPTAAVAEPTAPPVEPTAPPVEPTAAVAEPTAPPVEPTAPPVEPTSPPIEPTEPPVEPTAPPMTEAAATEVPPTEAPTEPPATEGPTEVPGRQDSTEIPVTAEPTAVPATEAPAATLESQPASVDSGSTPEQSLASGAFRYTIIGASYGDTIPDLPEINPVDIGEWVVLSMHGENWSENEQVFDMSEFRLYADGEEVLIDVGNEWVSGLLGHTPSYGNTDAILWAADEGHNFALTFLAPTGAQQLTLVAGDQIIDLSSALAEPRPLTAETNDPIEREYIEVEVVEVVDAETIVIEQDGIEQTVRYLGLNVPTDDDCFANEAAAANRAFVAGETVRLERQATDVDARGNWVRDVWAPAADGEYFLVSEALVAEGAATVGISEPNTRYEGWLLGSQSVAEAEERGLWGACAEDGPVGTTSQPEVVVPATNRLTYRRSRGEMH